MPITPTDGAETPLPARTAGPGDRARQTGQGVTSLLRAWGAGDVHASESLVRLVYAELHRQAQLALRHERDGHTLQPTAVVHEAWLRLGDQHDAQWESRTQFFAIAAQAMRRILIDAARQRKSMKHGVEKISLDDAPAISIEEDQNLIELDNALTELEKFDEQQCRIVELRYFAGLTIEETAEVLKISPTTVKREWTVARTWLYQRMRAEE